MAGSRIRRIEQGLNTAACQLSGPGRHPRTDPDVFFRPPGTECTVAASGPALESPDRPCCQSRPARRRARRYRRDSRTPRRSWRRLPWSRWWRLSRAVAPWATAGRSVIRSAMVCRPTSAKAHATVALTPSGGKDLHMALALLWAERRESRPLVLRHLLKHDDYTGRRSGCQTNCKGLTRSARFLYCF